MYGQPFGDTEVIKSFALEAEIDPIRAELCYNSLLRGRLTDQTAALDELQHLKAFRIIAYALPRMDKNGKGEAIRTLQQTSEPDPLIIKVLTNELEAMNYLIRRGGEDIAAHEATKQRLITTLSRQTGISPNGVNSQSPADVQRFIASIRAAPKSE